MNKRKQARYGKIGGLIGGKATGAKKRRGDSDFYRELVKKRWASQKKSKIDEIPIA